ncbi:hypothetical protein B5M42_019795 [Paenibacillus athensensis]|uniref:Uncharacterized protein n=1 Tax=Paenibacillus athensensis TaxID=1967502 RepID=A0A4Y8Q372_9BACL|nr:hypothetical protein [Paenibacillus athensensis]MCD1261051.1 hypothetical protein [Paenibacillus athensensis]
MWKKYAGLVPALLLLLQAALALTPATAAAADTQPLKLSQLEVQVMPEFVAPEDWPAEKPCLLTGIYGLLVNTGTAAYDGEIAVPVQASPDLSIHLVAELSESQDPTTQLAYELKDNKVVWKPAKALEPGQSYSFVVEYYSNPFTLKEKEHAFEFELQAAYDTDEAQLFVFKPADTIGFELSAQGEASFTSELGQEVYPFKLGALRSGQASKLSVKYLKDNMETVLAKHTRQAQQDQEAAASGGQTGQAAGTAAGAGTAVVDTGPLGTTDAAAGKPDASKDSWIIGGAIIIFGLFVFLGLRSYRAPLAARTTAAQEAEAQTQSAKRREQINALRRKLLADELNEEAYKAARKKWG